MHIYNQTRTSDENHNNKKKEIKKKGENIAEKKKWKKMNLYSNAL